VLDQRTVAVLDGSQYSAFGHGTMTAGIVHLVAPQAKIMPLKSFNADGTGYDSDILRAIYYAVKNGAKVLNMSFDYPSYSAELANAIKYANQQGSDLGGFGRK
jgi:subtilisin family serine protease